jgi:hypothetical protein
MYIAGNIIRINSPKTVLNPKTNEDTVKLIVLVETMMKGKLRRVPVSCFGLLAQKAQSVLSVGSTVKFTVVINSMYIKEQKDYSIQVCASSFEHGTVLYLPGKEVNQNEKFRDE